MNRKILQHNAGYIASRKNKINGNWAAIYLADAAGLDAGDKYAIVCEEHSTLTGMPSVKKARHFLKYPEFCEDCMADAPADESEEWADVIYERESDARRTNGGART